MTAVENSSQAKLAWNCYGGIVLMFSVLQSNLFFLNYTNEPDDSKTTVSRYQFFLELCLLSLG